MIWAGVALLSICRCCCPCETVCQVSLWSPVILFPSILTRFYELVAFFRMVYVSIILDIQVHEGGYHWGGHSAMQSHVPWGDWPPAVADLLCLWHRGPLIPVIRCPSCWDVGMSMVHAHVLFLLVVLSIECVLNLSYQLLISWVFKSESNQTQF